VTVATTEAGSDVVTATAAMDVGVDIAVVDEVETVTGTDVTIGAGVDTLVVWRCSYAFSSRETSQFRTAVTA